MSKRNPKPLLIDMLHCIEKIQDYRIPETFRNQYPHIEWTKIIRSGHIITHDYDDLDYAIIWKIITMHLTALKQSLEKILSGL